MSNYATGIEFTDYATARGFTVSGDPDALLTRAHDWIETLLFKGEKTDPAQANQWPRKEVYVDGRLLDDATVPAEVKKAEMQMAFEIDNGNDPRQAVQPKVIREKVASLETEYSDEPNAISTPVVRSVLPILRNLLSGGGGGLNLTRGY